jgi:hypothetical protein
LDSEQMAQLPPSRKPSDPKKQQFLAELTQAENAERDVLLGALRTGAARSQLITNVLKTVGTCLAGQTITADEPLEWVADEELLDWIRLGPEGKPQ